MAEVKNDEIQTVLVEEATALGPSTNWWLGATDKELVSFSVVINFDLSSIFQLFNQLFGKLRQKQFHLGD